MLRIPKIENIDTRYYELAQKRWDNLIKPQGSLGRMEELVCRLCAITQQEWPQVRKKRLIVFAGDHGIIQEGVSAYPQDVTAQMVGNFLRGTAAISVLARQSGLELKIVDMGVRTELKEKGLISVRVAAGTRNFLYEPAMTAEQMGRAIETGINLAFDAKKEGVELLAGGDMGIGNTAAASAIYSSLFQVDPEKVTGRGAGLDEKGRIQKVEVIRRAVNKWSLSADQPLEVLRHFGGFEIAALTGLYLGAASERIPAVVDGFICTAAAAIAMAMAPQCGEYLIFAHASSETGYRLVLERLQIEPLLDLRMRLGEGTGAALAMKIIDAAVELFREMPTFEQAEVSRRLEGQ